MRSFASYHSELLLDDLNQAVSPKRYEATYAPMLDIGTRAQMKLLRERAMNKKEKSFVRKKQNNKFQLVVNPLILIRINL